MAPIEKLNTVNVLVNIDRIEKKWWKKFNEEVPVERQCKIKNCKFAPPGHERHQIFSRDYSMTEMRMMIQYLVYYDEIANGRGYKVWKDMIERGYMLHRTYQSLQNNFRKKNPVEIQVDTVIMSSAQNLRTPFSWIMQPNTPVKNF